jgi:hypothetical protein
LDERVPSGSVLADLKQRIKASIGRLSAAARCAGHQTWLAYRLRWKRRRLLLRALRKGRQLRSLADRTAAISPGMILAASTMRNEIVRLPYFLDYYRKMGVGHFLVVDNDSDDGTAEYLAAQPDVSIWSTPESYKLSRFGVDWLTRLQMRHAHGHWCLTVDADELFVYPYCDTRPLPRLTGWLESEGVDSFGALLIDLYPNGPLNVGTYAPGQDPTQILDWFDGGNYMIQRHPVYDNLWIQGGVRARMFFAENPRRAPTLNKVPLVKWNRRYAYVSSTHQILPRRLNRVYAIQGGECASGALLHTKFLPLIKEKSAEELERKQHFENSELYTPYHEALIQSPDLWCKDSSRYGGWRQLVRLGLMSQGGWV